MLGQFVPAAVGNQESVAGLYRPPVSTPGIPAQTIISDPVHTALWLYRAIGQFSVERDFQELVAALYLPPSFLYAGELP